MSSRIFAPKFWEKVLAKAFFNTSVEQALEKEMLIAFRLLTDIWNNNDKAYNYVSQIEALKQSISSEGADKEVRDRIESINNEKIRTIVTNLNEIQKQIKTSQDKYANYISTIAPFDTSAFPWRYRGYLQYSCNIPRSKMPQIPREKAESIYNALEAKFGIVHKQMQLSDLRPTQNEINDGKVTSMLLGMDMLGDRTWFVSNDAHLMDGTHQWSALLQLNPKAIIEVCEIQAETLTILDYLNSLRAIEQVDINDNKDEVKPSEKKHGSVVWVRNEEGKYLILRRGGKAPWAPNQWFLPGGTWDGKESSFEVAQRELIEECGVFAQQMTLIGVAEHDKWSVYCYLAHMPSDLDISLNYEHEIYSWQDLESIAKLPQPKELSQHIAFLNRYLEISQGTPTLLKGLME